MIDPIQLYEQSPIKGVGIRTYWHPEGDFGVKFFRWAAPRGIVTSMMPFIVCKILTKEDLREIFRQAAKQFHFEEYDITRGHSAPIAHPTKYMHLKFTHRTKRKIMPRFLSPEFILSYHVEDSVHRSPDRGVLYLETIREDYEKIYQKVTKRGKKDFIVELVKSTKDRQKHIPASKSPDWFLKKFGIQRPGEAQQTV